jgi:cysteine desulfurase
MERVYLDYAATTPMHPEVAKAMLPYFSEAFGNPSSLHVFGREARDVLEKSRRQVAALLGADAEEIVFTGGGTEADNLALMGIALANKSKGNHIVTCGIEHHAVLETCRFLEEAGFKVTYLPVDRYGQVSPDAVKNAITGQTVLVSIMYANNEIGTVEPVPEIARIARTCGVYFHTDAVQAVGHVPINVNELGVDLLTMSAHKLYGPKGVGALFVRKGTRMAPFVHGGGQERDRRSGTENVPGAVGLARACELASAEMSEETQRLTSLRDRLAGALLKKVDFCRLNGHPTQRLPNIVNVAIGFVDGKTLCLHLDRAGICVSAGSACSSSNKEPSHVMLATGLSRQDAYSSVRFALGKWTTADDIERVTQVLPGMVEKLVDGRLGSLC